MESVPAQLQAGGYDRLEAKPQALSGLCWAPGASTVQSPQRKDTWRKTQCLMSERLSNVCERIHGDTRLGQWEGKKGRREIRIEREISEVHVSGWRTRLKSKQSGVSIFSSRFISCAVRQAFFLHNMYSTFERTWSLRDYSLLYCDYMAEDSTKVSHFWG